MSKTSQQQFLADFDGSLAQQRSMDASGRDNLLRLVEQALAESPSLEPAPGDGTGRDTWRQTLEMLGQHQLIDEEQRQALMRQFDEASDHDAGAVQWAVEFARRQRQDGDEAAREWLQQQVAAEAGAAAGAQAPSGMTADVALSLRRRR